LGAIVSILQSEEIEKPSTVITVRASQKKMKKMYFFDDDFVYFSSKWHLSTNVFQCPPQTISTPCSLAT
jgi:hypothetical protein